MPEDQKTILEELASREPIFHRAADYRAMADFETLMAPGYWEVDASGRRYSRTFILQHLATNQPVDAEKAGWRATDFQCQALGPTTYLLTYRLDQNGRLTRRATVWQKNEDHWQILYHQGTLCTAEQDDTPPGSGYAPRSRA